MVAMLLHLVGETAKPNCTHVVDPLQIWWLPLKHSCSSLLLLTGTCSSLNDARVVTTAHDVDGVDAVGGIVVVVVVVVLAITSAHQRITIIYKL